MISSGICVIKSQYIAEISNNSSETNSNEPESASNHQVNHNPPSKKQKLELKKKKNKGQNKSRPVTFRQNRETQLCHSLIDVREDEVPPKCPKLSCNFIHDTEVYLKIKPPDIGDECYNFKNFGHCPRGLTCRFGKNHITENGKNKIDKEHRPINHVLNNLSIDTQQLLRKKQYNFKLAENVVKYYDSKKKEQQEKVNTNNKNENLITTGDVLKTQGTVTDEDVVKLLNREKKKINWRNKLYLSPLTTVGNLPFRRICKEFGADITCGEMAMCSSLLQGSPNEWALVKRHPAEDLFGVQLCTNNPYLIAKCALLLEQNISVDFVDLNLGCPIDLVYKEGAGCGLLRRPKVLEACVRSASTILNVPFTVKTRMGVYNNDNVAHKMVKKFEEWGASAVTIHGRSREQRYTKLADWSYIQTCVKAAYSFPIIGNGDILSYEDYKLAIETCPEMATVMIGRGALIKPWIFTEIKEQKLWDISSSERFNIIKKYVNYGLEHWGSDTKGVENTRRFLLEWLSFLHRYVPVGLLETPPQKMNQRPPKYVGRNDLETLMASSSSMDWIKISEMLLGPVPEGFQFLPKHKANAY
ncbi:tRNA-dihydrouridine(47) synthase [NAD(P)(+)]-like [Agrilus planipennis]|uniref:tRNA-dihydrouridine(47) synthase [NAD(P)(+)] n=1 Tax=Agrilus planipennis TaxID=224129 RepID=A0A1W4XW40_AGRPL|nr:tRNA-dihydrouridine(47) synthase [NAD(P)(+)]-like [Agrilus planipennis]